MDEKIIDILNRFFGENWFLDSGSLLGAVRENSFLKTDCGIDVSIICNTTSESDIRQAVEELCKLGYLASKYKWAGKIYKYCLVQDKKNTYKYALDLHLFREFDKTYYGCPQVSVTQNMGYMEKALFNLKKGSVLKRKKGITGLIKYCFCYVYRYVFHCFGTEIDMDKLIRDDNSTYFWLIPKTMYHGTVKGFNSFNILNKPEEYLKFRYNDWRTPVSNWVTLRDDGGLKKCTRKDIDIYMANS